MILCTCVSICDMSTQYKTIGCRFLHSLGSVDYKLFVYIRTCQLQLKFEDVANNIAPQYCKSIYYYIYIHCSYTNQKEELLLWTVFQKPWNIQNQRPKTDCICLERTSHQHYNQRQSCACARHTSFFFPFFFVYT